MKKITISKIVAGALMAAISITTSFAQTNLGAECGCPPVPTTVDVTGSTRPAGVIADANADGILDGDQTWGCDKTWTLKRKIYVPNGVTLTIMPGTVVRGEFTALPADAVALIISRGGKIIADGTKDCPIVFTADVDPMDGNYPLTNVGRWGGIVVLGTAINNITTANTLTAGGVNGVSYIEGFTAENLGIRHGAGDAAFPTNDINDNSGILRYVSIRHAGAQIVAGNELNGLTLGSVGRGTTVENIEIVANADDNIEIFGGNVNIKYVSTLFGDDDMFDYDLGWVGKGQFLFGIAGDPLTGLHSTDNGFEADGDDNSRAPALLSHPVFYNVTLIGNGNVNPTSDNSGAAAIQAKELTQGEIYNSIFANFRSGLHLATSRSTVSGDGYDNWTNNAALRQGTSSVANSFIVKNNTFIGFGPKAGATVQTARPYMTKGTMVTGSPRVWKAATVASDADSIQFFQADGNSVVASVPGFDYNWAWNSSAQQSYSDNPFHATPLINIPATTLPPADGFFSVVNYRGAFDANKGSWLSDWALNQVLTSYQSNPTDINNDGTTNVDDYLILLGKFNVPNSK